MMALPFLPTGERPFVNQKNPQISIVKVPIVNVLKLANWQVIELSQKHKHRAEAEHPAQSLQIAHMVKARVLKISIVKVSIVNVLKLANWQVIELSRKHKHRAETEHPAQELQIAHMVKARVLKKSPPCVQK